MAVIGGHRVVLQGTGAIVRLGYQKAAVLGDWRVEGSSFTARVVEADGFRITQTPLTLEVQNRVGGPTVRRLGDVTIYQGQLSARLLPRQE